jgi:hypothetical protein
MAGAIDVGGAALFEGLVGAGLLSILVVRLAVRRSHGFLEDVFETFVREVAFLVGDPFLQPKMRLDDEFLIFHAVLRLHWTASIDPNPIPAEALGSS